MLTTDKILQSLREMLIEVAELEPIRNDPLPPNAQKLLALIEPFIAATTPEAQLETIRALQKYICGGMGSYSDLGFTMLPAERISVGYWVFNMGYAPLFGHICHYLSMADERLSENSAPE